MVGDLWWQDHVNWKERSFARSKWSFETSGLSWQWSLKTSCSVFSFVQHCHCFFYHWNGNLEYYTLEPVLKDHSISHKCISQDRWSLVTGSFASKCGTYYQEYVVLKDTWSVLAPCSALSRQVSLYFVIFPWLQICSCSRFPCFRSCLWVPSSWPTSVCPTSWPVRTTR